MHGAWAAAVTTIDQCGCTLPCRCGAPAVEAATAARLHRMAAVVVHSVGAHAA